MVTFYVVPLLFWSHDCTDQSERGSAGPWTLTCRTARRLECQSRGRTPAQSGQWEQPLTPECRERGEGREGREGRGGGEGGEGGEGGRREGGREREGERAEVGMMGGDREHSLKL